MYSVFVFLFFFLFQHRLLGNLLLCDHLKTLPPDDRQPGFEPAACGRAAGRRSRLQRSVPASGASFHLNLSQYHRILSAPALFTLSAQSIIQMRRRNWSTHAGARADLTWR